MMVCPIITSASVVRPGTEPTALCSELITTARLSDSIGWTLLDPGPASVGDTGTSGQADFILLGDGGTELITPHPAGWTFLDPSPVSVGDTGTSGQADAHPAGSTSSIPAP